MGNAEGSNGKSNDELVDNLVKNDVVKKKEIELVMRLVDRGRFVPPSQRKEAYRDVALKSQTGGPGFLHLSAPCIYASVLENLKLEKGLSFLNIGSGTGYLSTMAGFLLGTKGVNHGLELYENILDHSQNCVEKTLMSAEVSAFEWCEPKFFIGNAYQIKTEMRYDRIYCGALVPHNNRSYFCNLLKIGGVFVVPYDNSLQRIVRQSETQFVVYDVSSVVFSQLVLPNQENEFTIRQIDIPLLEPSRLMDICRNKIRQCVREETNEKCSLQMRYQCLKPRGRSDESGSTSSELDPFRQPPARRNRFPLWIVGRAHMFLFDDEVPIDEVNADVVPHGDAEQRREPNVNPRQFFAMIGERIARHQRDRARNAAARPNPAPQDLINAREADPRNMRPAANVMPPGGGPQILDDGEFELKMGFRFKRGRPEEENGENNFGNLRFGPRHRIIVAEEDVIDQNLELDLAPDEPNDALGFNHPDEEQTGRQDDRRERDEEVIHAIIVDEELDDGIGHALDDPPADPEDALNESFGAESDATYELADEHQQIEVDPESGGSDGDENSSSDDQENSGQEEEDANISGDELRAHQGHSDNPDDDEHDADQTEGARLQALQLASFHEEFTNRLDALPLSTTMLAFVKTREAAFINQSPADHCSSIDDLEERLFKDSEMARENSGAENQL